jgi:hypothetical protein
MHARLDDGRVQLLTRTGLDWRYQHTVDALKSLPVRTAYIDGELCAPEDHPAPAKPIGRAAVTTSALVFASVSPNIQSFSSTNAVRSISHQLDPLVTIPIAIR